MSVQPSLDQITLVLDGEWDVPAEWDVPTAPEFESDTSGLTEYDFRCETGGGGSGNGYC
jgi:hypothetical protein